MAKALTAEDLDFDEIPTTWVKTKDSDNNLQFYSTIDSLTQSWLNTLHHVWSLWKKSVGVTRTLHEYFDTAPNPYLSTLRILVNTRDFHHIKSRSSLPFTVIEEFTNWITPKKDKYKECLADELKIAAFELVSKQRNNQLLKMVSDVYELPENNHLFVNVIKELIEEKKYKDAGQFVEMLQLQNSFSDPEVLILPLILQNKTTIAEDLMKSHPVIQQKVVIYLDNLLSPDVELLTVLNKYIDDNKIPDVKMCTFSHKPLAKLVARLAKLYNLSPEQCPFLHKKRSEGALQFLVYKRYVDGSLSAESFREMAKEAVANDQKLQTKILEFLVNNNDTMEALHFAQNFNVPQNMWPWHLENYVNENPNLKNNCEANECSKDEENWDVDDTTVYHALNLPRESIHIINDPKSFQHFLDNGLLNINLVGIDSEWKPSFSIKKPELALIQIATHADIYIIDVTTLGNDVPWLWTSLGSSFFNNKSILKLGFGIANDISVIKESLPALSQIRACGEGYLDLSHLWKRLQKEDNFFFPYEGDESFTNENLSKLAELCLGQRLNKSDQFSNWEKRPLRESQIVYASLDAYCLIEIYDVLAIQCERLGIPFQDVCHHPAHKSPTNDGKKSSRSRSKKTKNNRQNVALHNDQESRVFDKMSFDDQRQQSQKNHFSYWSQNVWSEPKQTYFKGSQVPLEVTQKTSQKGHLGFYNPPNHSQQQQYQQQSSMSGMNKSFVCDSMLGGLARQLRKCGVDCVYLAHDRGGDNSCRIAYDEKRVLLTKNGNFERFQQYLPPGYCYNVIEYKPENQLEEIINQFNIKITEADIFSRCQICNSDEFVFVSNHTMFQLLNNVSAPNSHPHSDSSTNNTKEVYNYWDTADAARHMSDKKFTWRSWRMRFGTLNVTNCTTKYNTKVQIDRVPPKVLNKVNNFYVCEGCGKVYWYGSHLEHVLKSSLKDILS